LGYQPYQLWAKSQHYRNLLCPCHQGCCGVKLQLMCISLLL